jgi:hypothetical protein
MHLAPMSNGIETYSGGLEPKSIVISIIREDAECELFLSSVEIRFDQSVR